MKYLTGAAALLLAAPAAADVKAGVDAWSRGEFAKAVAEWRDPALRGDADAQFNMGQAYKLGRGVPVDLAVAQGWYRKAALQGHLQAEDNLGLSLFQDGRKEEALPWLEKAAARDEKRAELVLGTMYFNGDAVKKDWVRAYALVTRASQQALPQASRTLAQMDGYIPEAQRQQGTELAATIARDAKLKAVSAPPPRAVADTGAPGSRFRPLPGQALPPKKGSPAKATPVKRPPATIASGPPSPPRGAWRIQLGAFADAANARALWARVGARTGGAPAYVKAGPVTRLQATGFASRAAALVACGKSGVGCVVVAP